jgi:hypothetical protein
MRATWIDEGPVVLIAMERGSQWPAWARAEVSEALVLQQQIDETPLAFAHRVARRLSRLATRHCSLHRLVLSVAPEATERSIEARCRILQAALRIEGSSVRGRVVLSADDPFDQALRHELLALVGALSDQLGGHDVGLRFGRPLHGPAKCSSRRVDLVLPVIDSPAGGPA